MHLGIVVPAATGHLNPSLALGRELSRRGHRVSVFTSPRMRSAVDAIGLSFVPIGAAEDADGRAATAIERLGRKKGASALLYTGRLIGHASAILLRDLPGALELAGVDGLIVDQVCPGAAVVAERNSLPYVVACNAIAVYFERESPPPTTMWRYRPGTLGRVRNRLIRSIVPPIIRLAAGTGGRGVSPLLLNLEHDRGLAVVAQQPGFFNFPGATLPDHFHATGPWHEPSRDDTLAFPWERLDGRPLVYASLGTVQNRLARLYEAILAAVDGLDLQLVLALGQRQPGSVPRVSQNAIIVPYAPQLRLLDRAAAAITHAGMNTAMECLSRGVPMLCLPITNDQPGVARRVEWLGAGAALPIAKATPHRLRRLLTNLLEDDRYRTACRRYRDVIANTNGVASAADVIEHALRTRTRVPSGWNCESPRDAEIISGDVAEPAAGRDASL